jgi:hypothetical protein
MQLMTTDTKIKELRMVLEWLEKGPYYKKPRLLVRYTRDNTDYDSKIMPKWISDALIPLVKASIEHEIKRLK